jgi:hypothetical protein
LIILAFVTEVAADHREFTIANGLASIRRGHSPQVDCAAQAAAAFEQKALSPILHGEMKLESKLGNNVSLDVTVRGRRIGRCDSRAFHSP